MVDEKLVRVALHKLGKQPHNPLHYLVQFDALLARVTEESGQSGSDDQARELVEWLHVWDGDARRNQFHFDADAWDAIWKIRFRGEHYVDIDRAREFLRHLRKRPNLQPEGLVRSRRNGPLPGYLTESPTGPHALLRTLSQFQHKATERG